VKALSTLEVPAFDAVASGEKGVTPFDSFNVDLYDKIRESAIDYLLSKLLFNEDVRGEQS